MNAIPPPGPSRQRQVLVLTGLLVLLTGVLWYQLRPTARPAPASKAGERPPAAIEQVPLPQPVQLTALEPVPERTEVGRNPFGFGVRPEPPRPVSSFTPAPVLPPPGPPPPPEGPPPIRLKLTGMLEVPGNGRTMVMLKDADSGASFQAFEGDIVDGRYRIVKVGLQSVVVSYVDGTGSRTIALGG